MPIGPAMQPEGPPHVGKRLESAHALLVPFVLVFAVLGDRLQVGVAGGDQGGSIPVLILAAPIAAMMLVGRNGGGSLRFLKHPAFVLCVLPYLTLSAVLPSLGVLANGYAPRTLLSMTEATTALSLLVVGSAITSVPLRTWAPWLVIAISAQLAYAAGQAAYQAGLPGAALFDPLFRWDLSLVGLETYVHSRSIGFYLNPNVLGLWAAFAAALSLTMPSSRWRWIGVAMAMATLVLSQSRGAGMALIVGLVVAVLTFGLGRSGREMMMAAATLLIGIIIAVIAAVMIAPSADQTDRLISLLLVVTEGPSADPNLSGRIDFWAAVIDLNLTYPWGTWGPPERILGTAVDSTWFSVFAQGSVPYLTAFAMVLGSALALRDRDGGDTLRILTVIVAVAGVTQTPISYPVIVIFWVLLGAAVGSPQTRLAAPRVAAGNQGRSLPISGQAHRRSHGDGLAAGE